MSEKVPTDKPRHDPKGKGEISEAVVLAHLLKQGFSVSIPFGNNQRYDFLIDDETRILRVQVKTGRIEKGCVVFSCSSTNGFTYEKRGYKGEADLFLVYCPTNGEIYQVPVASAPDVNMRLRIDPPDGGPKTTINWARDYRVN